MRASISPALLFLPTELGPMRMTYLIRGKVALFIKVVVVTLIASILLMLAQSQFEYLNSMLDDSDQMKVENLTDTEDQGHLISMLWDRTNQFDDDEVGLVLEYLSDWIDAHPGESVFNYATLKPIVEEVFMRH